MNMYQKTAQELLHFLKQSPTSFHAVYEMGKILRQESFYELKEHEKWN